MTLNLSPVCRRPIASSAADFATRSLSPDIDPDRSMTSDRWTGERPPRGAVGCLRCRGGGDRRDRRTVRVADALGDDVGGVSFEDFGALRCAVWDRLATRSHRWLDRSWPAAEE